MTMAKPCRESGRAVYALGISTEGAVVGSVRGESIMTNGQVYTNGVGAHHNGAHEGVENVIIVGSGPAGFTAGLYTARANLNPLLITGNEYGGQVSITYEVENYPGFPESLSWPELF